MTYSELVAAIQSYTENTFPATELADGTFVSSTEQINRFIEQAEQRIYNTVLFPALRRNVTGTMTAGNRFVRCPDDFLSVYSIAIIDSNGDFSYLLNKDTDYLRSAYPRASTLGTPKVYAIYGPQFAASTELTFMVAPTPDVQYTMELNYFFYPESIVTAGETWLSTNYDPVLLYGALVEAYTFMKGDKDLLAMYTMRYKEALAEAKRLGDGLERQDTYRSGMPRVPVT